MRLIDGDELLEYVWRERLDSRERIANLVVNMPTVNMKSQVMEEIKNIVNDYYNRKGDTSGK